MTCNLKCFSPPIRFSNSLENALLSTTNHCEGTKNQTWRNNDTAESYFSWVISSWGGLIKVRAKYVFISWYMYAFPGAHIKTSFLKIFEEQAMLAWRRFADPCDKMTTKRPYVWPQIGSSVLLALRAWKEMDSYVNECKNCTYCTRTAYVGT